MKSFSLDEIKKRKRFIYISITILIIIFALILYGLFSEKPKIVKIVPKRTTYSLSSIGLSIKKDGYLFTSKDNGYKKLKSAIEDVLNTIEKPALENNTFPESSKKTKDGSISIEDLKNKTVNVGSIIYVDDNVKTQIKFTPELERLGQGDSQGFLVLPVHQFVIVLSGDYKGLLFTKSDQNSERWSAWEINKDSIQRLTELVRQGIK